MTTGVLTLALGALLILVAILGGGFEIKELKVPKVGRLARTMSAFAGLFFICLGLGIDTPQSEAKKEDPKPVEFTVYDQLGESQITEQVTLLIDGKMKGQLTVDLKNPNAMMTITLPGPGRYSYAIEASTTIQVQGQYYERSGAGQGMIEAGSGKEFEVEGNPGADPFVVALVERRQSQAQLLQSPPSF